MPKIKQISGQFTATVEFSEEELDILQPVFEYDLKGWYSHLPRVDQEKIDRVVGDMRQALNAAKRNRDEARGVLSGTHKANRV